jgi:hypothetical protein
MGFRDFLILESDFVMQREVPPEPGTTPIPPNHVRLYHYTNADAPTDEANFQAAERLRNNGILISQAIGQSYGEPNVVWGSSSMPEKQKVFAEFSIDVEDPRWAMGGLRSRDPKKFHSDAYFSDSIRPDEIIGVHEPWHHKYRYLMNNPDLIKMIKVGEFDHLLSKSDYGPAVRRVKAE